MFCGSRVFVSAMALYGNSCRNRIVFAKRYYKTGCRAQIKNPRRNISPKIKWNDEQKQVLDFISNGHSVFITGSAGTGKSVLLLDIIKTLKKRHGRNSVFVTAPTGVAACVLQGQTLHSFAGIGHITRDRESMLNRILGDKAASRRWKTAKALVIDEISMVDADLFENLEYIARKVRNSDDVWGGLKLVVSGDFFQLPPVKPQNSLGKEFAFESDCWDSSFDVQVELTQIFRQSDSRLINLLQDIRKGRIDQDDLELLRNSCSIIEEEEHHPSAVHLYPRIDDVNKANELRMKALTNRKVTYVASDKGKNAASKRQLSRGLAPDQLELCEGARVMLIKNLSVSGGLVNGSTGTVAKFTSAEVAANLTTDVVLPVVKFDSGKEVLITPETWSIMEGDSCLASRIQLPLVLAWAVTIHKCQGSTLDNVHTDLSRAFGCGMVYVALSRVRRLENLHISGFCARKIRAHPKVLQFNRRFAQGLYKSENQSQVRRSSVQPRREFSLKDFLLSRTQIEEE